MNRDDRVAQRLSSRRVRRSIAGSDRRERETSLCAHLASLTTGAAVTIGVTVADDGEPDLSSLVAGYWAAGVEVALPVPAPHDNNMSFRRWQRDDVLAPGRFGIPCPPDGTDRIVTPSMVFVPLVAFDASGNRLGRGAGFYDRWLSNHDVLAIGVGFEAQRVDRLTPAPHDVALDAIVTELGIRWFRPTDIG